MLYYPSTRQEHKTAPGLLILDHFKVDAGLSSLPCRLLEEPARTSHRQGAKYLAQVVDALGSILTNQ